MNNKLKFELENTIGTLEKHRQNSNNISKNKITWVTILVVLVAIINFFLQNISNDSITFTLTTTVGIVILVLELKKRIEVRNNPKKFLIIENNKISCEIENVIIEEVFVQNYLRIEPTHSIAGEYAQLTRNTLDNKKIKQKIIYKDGLGKEKEYIIPEHIKDLGHFIFQMHESFPQMSVSNRFMDSLSKEQQQKVFKPNEITKDRDILLYILASSILLLITFAIVNSIY